MTEAFVLLVLVAAFLGWRALRPRPPAPDQQRAKDDARAAEVRADAAADTQRAADTAKADVHAAQVAELPLDERAQRHIDRARARKAGLLCLLGALFASVPTRAADCVEDKASGKWTCTADGYRDLVDEADTLEHERDVCAVDLTAAEAKRAAAVARAEALEQLPQPSPWPWVAAGASGALAVVLVTALLVR